MFEIFIFMISQGQVIYHQRIDSTEQQLNKGSPLHAKASCYMVLRYHGVTHQLYERGHRINGGNFEYYDLFLKIPQKISGLRGGVTVTPQINVFSKKMRTIAISHIVLKHIKIL